MHFKTRSGHATLQFQAVTLEVLATRGLQSVLTLSPVKVSMTAVRATKCTFSDDKGWYGTSYDCSLPQCSVHGWCGTHIPRCGVHCWRGVHIPRCGVRGSTLPGLAHLQMIPNGFLCNVWSAVNGYTLLCNLHTNRTSASIGIGLTILLLHEVHLLNIVS